MLSKRAETPEFIEEKGLEIDADYYINRQILPPVERILSSVGVEKNELLGFGRQANITDIMNGNKRTLKRNIELKGISKKDSRDMGSWKGKTWKGQRMPVLEEVLDLIPSGKKFHIELKGEVRDLQQLFQVLRSSSVESRRIRILSFNSEVISKIKKQAPEIPAFWLKRFHGKPGEQEKILDTLKKIRADGLSGMAHSSMDPSFLRRVRELGLEFHVWTVNDPRDFRYFHSMGTVSLTTDRPGHMISCGREKCSCTEHTQNPVW
jgi:glycerophosphoryl diester phosphodiesterase